jgi:hypothetical protein
MSVDWIKYNFIIFILPFFNFSATAISNFHTDPRLTHALIHGGACASHGNPYVRNANTMNTEYSLLSFTVSSNRCKFTFEIIALRAKTLYQIMGQDTHGLLTELLSPQQSLIVSLKLKIVTLKYSSISLLTKSCSWTSESSSFDLRT